MLSYKDGTAVRLVSRAGKDHDRRFAELAVALRALPAMTRILDGEVAIFDDTLISRSLRERRVELERVLDDDQVLLFPARRLGADGLEAWAQVIERGYEGLVGKDEASLYREGRTLSWLKVKVPKYREGERGWDPKC